MKAFLATCILTGALIAGGCATKKYVRNTTAPVQAKVDQVGEQTQKQGQDIEQTKGEVKQVDERAQSGINAAKERAMTAENRANDAMGRANQATDMANKNSSEISSLRQVVSNLDDYKLQDQVTVPFKFNQYKLSDDAKRDLDKIAGDIKNDKRFFIAVEGYTDRTGSKQYNEALSRRRADAVVQYLVASHDVPIYRIHMIGLGDQKPADEGKGRAARAKNRRVEVRIFSADQAMASNAAPAQQGQMQNRDRDMQDNNATQGTGNETQPNRNQQGGTR